MHERLLLDRERAADKKKEASQAKSLSSDELTDTRKLRELESRSWRRRRGQKREETTK